MDIGEQNGLSLSASPKGRRCTAKLFQLLALCIFGLASLAAVAAPSPWQKPAEQLAQRIADLLGPGQASLTIRNMSSIPSNQVPDIRDLLVQALRARGINAADKNAANTVSVTLSENTKERLWVAQVIKGKQTRVAMIDAGPASVPQVHTVAGLMLHRTRVFAGHKEILAVLQTQGGLVVLEPQRIVIYAHTPAGWQQQQRAGITYPGPLPRDPRGILLPPQHGNGFAAWLPGVRCNGNFLAGPNARYWTIGCHQSKDPWVISSGSNPQASAEPRGVAPALPTQLPNRQSNPMAAGQPSTPALKAFYDSARDYFTGVIEPKSPVQLQPFYSAAYLPRPGGRDALLIGGIDGKVQLLANGKLAPVDGARDWGSDFTALHSGCGTGTQIVTSAAGQGLSDSLRAYELHALDAIPASDPLTINGTVMALWTAPRGSSVMAVVRSAPNQYEVDRVTATCN